jgi:hypothetical protein
MTDELEVMSRVVEYHDHITPPGVPVAEDVRRGRRRVRRNRGIATGAMAAAVAGVFVTASLLTGVGHDTAPAPATPSPSPTPTRTQSAQTWADTPVPAAKGTGWTVPDPLTKARNAWFPAVREHLDDGSGGIARFDGRNWGGEFERQTEGSIYSSWGDVGLVVDRSGLDPFDGCRYLMKGPKASNGTESCSAERFEGPDGERARIARYQRLCATWDPGQAGDDARPGPGQSYATCGDFRVAVAVSRHDGRIGFVVVEGRGTTDYIPFTRAAMAAVAADARLTLPDSAFAVPSNDAVESVVVDHFPDYEAGDEDEHATEHPGYAQVWGGLGRVRLSVTVRPAGEAPTCGRAWLTSCVARRVYGAGDPTTVYVGAWDEDDWADCCPKNSRATSRVLVYVGPRNTVVVSETLVVKEHQKAVGADLDQRLIDFLLDPRLQ